MTNDTQKKPASLPLIQNVNQQDDPMLDASHPASRLGQIPSYGSGGPVPNDQVAQLHEGERVLEPNEAHAYRAAAQGEAPPTALGAIATRAHEIYNQGKDYLGNLGAQGAALGKPLDSEAAAFKEKQQQINEAMGTAQPAQQAPAPSTQMRPLAPHQAQPHAAYGSRPGEKRIDTTEMLKPLPSYDGGGEVPEDQVAKVHEDEHVLTPEENAAYQQAEQEVKGAPADFGGPIMPNPKGIKVQSDTDAPEVDKMTGGAKMSTDNAPLTPAKMDTSNPPHNEMEPGPVQEASAKSPLGAAAPASTGMKPLPGQAAPAPEATPAQTPAEEQAPDIMKIIHQDKLAAASKGTAGLADLGTAMIHEKAFAPKKEENAGAGPDLVAPTPEMPKYTGPMKPIQTMEHQAFEQKRKDYDQRVQAAMDLGTPEGDREAASLQLAKQHFEKLHPYGSEDNHPGVLGKIEHGLAKAGNIAGDIVAPGTMALIPGTALNKQNQAQQLRGQEQAATKEGLEQAQTRVAGVKTVPERVYQSLMTRGPNGTPAINPDTQKPYLPEEAQVASTGVGKTPVQVLANSIMHDVNPDTGKNYTQKEALEEAMKEQAGTRMNEHQKRVADYVSAHNMEDTPANRETARVAIERTDTEAKAQAGLPTAETKARFNNNLSTAKALLVQQNADADARGLKADELQVTENTRNSSTMSRLDTAKNALKDSDDDQFAAQIVPITSLLAVTSAEGVKRVNKQELDKFVPSSGSFGRWVDAHAEQFLEGKIPTEYRDEVGHMLDRMTAAETAEHIINTRSIDGTIRQGAQQPVQKPGGGAQEKPTKSTPQAPAAEKKAEPAAGGTTGGYADWKKKQQQAH